jgi:ribosome-associated protein
MILAGGWFGRLPILWLYSILPVAFPNRQDASEWIRSFGLEVTHDNRLGLSGNAGAQPADLRCRDAFSEGGPLNGTALETLTSRAQLAADHAFMCARIGQDNKGKDILVLDMRGITPLYDYFVIMTGASRRQIHTLAEEIDAAMAAEGDKRLSIAGYQASRWVIQDYGDIVVHVFDKDARDYYALEELWADAPRLDWERG